jgi:hypothetical protein
MLGSIATIVGMLLMGLLPLLVPAVAAVVHIIGERLQPSS